MVSTCKNAVLAVVLAVMGISQAGACRCLQRDLCELVAEATLVVHATPSTIPERTSGGNDPVSYAMNTIELYKGEQIDAQRLTITTAGSSAACGIYMELGEEYLIGAYRDATSGQFTASTCDLFRSWSDVTKEELTLLEQGCAFEEGCGEGCGEFQDCVFYEEESEYYCTDFCDPDRCPENEVCDLQTVTCVRAPCPPLAICLEDPCNGTCAETQTCVPYLETSKWYCSDE